MRNRKTRPFGIKKDRELLTHKKSQQSPLLTIIQFTLSALSRRDVIANGLMREKQQNQAGNFLFGKKTGSTAAAKKAPATASSSSVGKNSAQPESTENSSEVSLMKRLHNIMRAKSPTIGANPYLFDEQSSEGEQ